MIKEHLTNIKKIFQMAMVELRKTYSRAALGWFWIFAKPAVKIFMYWFVFSIGLKTGQEIAGIPYYLWLIIGMLPWLYISDMISSSPDAYKRYGYLVTKIKFPISIIPTFISVSKLIVNTMLLAIVFIIYISAGGKLDLHIFNLLFYSIMMFVHYTALGSLLAMIGSFSKDFANLIKTLPTPLLFFSAVFFDISSISLPIVRCIQYFNPITYIANGYRNAFIYKIWFFADMPALVVFAVETVILIIISLIMYNKINKDIPDYL